MSNGQEAPRCDPPEIGERIAQWTISPEGIGPIRWGMRVEALENAFVGKPLDAPITHRTQLSCHKTYYH
ncbi:MAG: hypothetical protein HQL96_17580 [Magnetococcales bacterium]|nr:hypothetical protein [Magnetococcales bacterium]